MFLPNYPFGCHSNQSKSELEIKAYFHFFPVRWVISLLLIYIICPGLLLQFCLVISGLCLGITTPEMTLTISSSSCIGIINIYFNTLLKRRLVQLFLYKIYHSTYDTLGWKKYHEYCNKKKKKKKKKKHLAQKNKIVGYGSRTHDRLIRSPTR